MAALSFLEINMHTPESGDTTSLPSPTFALGQIVATPGALRLLEAEQQALHTFLHLKVASDLDYEEKSEGRSRVPKDADRIYTMRAHKLALDGLEARAKKQGWACLPILEVYIASTSRRRTRDAHRDEPLQDNGLHEHRLAL
jgi:hypothetical protein